MPLVLATGAATESGHAYANVLGVEYEYPVRYPSYLSPGELFVYFRGRRIPGGGTHPQVDLGCGTVGPSRKFEGGVRLVCSIEDFAPFETPVPFRDANGYLEPGGTRRGYFQPGVRRISDDDYSRIVSAGLTDAESPNSILDDPYSHATPFEARRIEEISRRAAADIIRQMPGVLSIETMPFNNPGYDLIATTVSGRTFVEVKGSRSALAKFFLSEGERAFGAANAANYLLVVVVVAAGVDLRHET